MIGRDSIEMVSASGFRLYDHGIRSDAAAEVASAVKTRIFVPVDIGGDGHPLDFQWAPVAGATSAEVNAATLTIRPDVAERVAPAPFKTDAAGWVIDVPAGTRVRAIGLAGFKGPDGTAITGAPPDKLRIAISFPRAGASGFDAPRFAVPPVKEQGTIPQSLTGASLSNGTITLNPAVAAGKVRVALVSGDNPATFVEQPSQLQSATLATHAPAKNAALAGPDGAKLWASPLFDPDGPDATIDLSRALTAAFSAAVAAGKPPAATMTLAAAAPANALLRGGNAHGVLVHAIPGLSIVAVEGAPAILPAAPTFASERPSRVVADLRIKYLGIRLAVELSDMAPAAGAAAGTIVGKEGWVRTLPTGALRDARIAQLGLRGMAAEPTELVVEVLDALDGHALGVAVLMLAPGPLGDVWAVFAKPIGVDRAIAVRARASTGRFFWADGPNAAPSLKIAIADTDPGGRPVRIGNDVLAAMTGPGFSQRGATLPAGAFTGRGPQFSSDLFVTLELSDLRLEYVR